MGANQTKGHVEIDVKRQAWVRNRRPNPAHPKHQGLNRTQNAAGAHPQTARSQQHYDAPASYYQQEPEAPIRGYGDEGRSYHDERALGRAHSTHSQSRRDQPSYGDDFDDEAGGMPYHGHRHEGSAHHNSRGLSHGQSGGRRMSHAQSNSRHGGPSQRGHDFAPSAEHMRTPYAASGSHRGNEHDSQYSIRHGSQRGSQHDSHHGIPHGSHRSSQQRSQRR